MTKMRLFSICTDEKDENQEEEAMDENDQLSSARISHDVESILDDKELPEK